MATSDGRSREPVVFLSYSYLEDDEEGRIFKTPEKIVHFAELIANSGFPRDSIVIGSSRAHSNTEPSCASLDWRSWYEHTMKESDIVLCFVSHKYLHAVEKGVDECGARSLGDLELDSPYLPGGVVNKMILYNTSLSFVPVFLGLDKDYSLLPLALQGRKCYTLKYPFDATTVQASQDRGLKDLSSQVFHMGTSASTSAVANLYSVAKSSHCTYGNYSNLYLDARSFDSFPKVELILKKISEHVRKPWNELAQQLGLSRTDIDAIEYNYRDFREQCYQVLMRWNQDHASVATVAEFANAIKNTSNQHQLLQALADALEQLARV